MKKNLLKPLKKILTSLTGEETEDKNIVAVVDKIADAVENNGFLSNNNENTLIISEDQQTGTLNKTWMEIRNALSMGKRCIVMFEDETGVDIAEIYSVIQAYGSSGSGYYIYAMILSISGSASPIQFFTDSADGYPTLIVEQ